MYEHLKKRIIKDLMSEISCLGATKLELVGHNVVGIREGNKMVHHGINQDYKPVEFTVDSFSEDSMVVTEYSTEQGSSETKPGSANKTAPFPKDRKRYPACA